MKMLCVLYSKMRQSFSKFRNSYNFFELIFNSLSLSTRRRIWIIRKHKTWKIKLVKEHAQIINWICSFSNLERPKLLKERHDTLENDIIGKQKTKIIRDSHLRLFRVCGMQPFEF